MTEASLTYAEKQLARVSNEYRQAVKDAYELISELKKQLSNKDEIIADANQEISSLKAEIEDLRKQAA